MNFQTIIKKNNYINKSFSISLFNNLNLFSSKINSYNYKSNLNKIILINKNNRLIRNLNYKDFKNTPNIIESNFISIPKEENYFTKNDSYINNKKIQFYDKYEFDNNKFTSEKHNIYNIKKLFQRRKKNYFKSEFRLIKNNNKQICEFNSEKNNSLFYSYDKDYLKKNNNNSLYQELNIMKNNIYKNYFYNNSLKSHKINNLSGYEYLLNKKQNRELLYSIKKNVLLYKNLNYNNKSEKNRYIKMIEIFSNLKNLIELDKNSNKFDYIKEFLKKNNIDTNNYNDENLKNFFNFINMENIPIDLTKSIKQNILDGLNFKENFLIKLKKNVEAKYFLKIKKYQNNNNNSSDNLLKNYINQDMEKQKKIFEKKIIKK